MAIFKRQSLKDKGMTEEQIDFVMNEAGRVFAGYTPTTEVQAQIDAAVQQERQKAAAPVNVLESDEYKKLLYENTKIKTLQTDDFAAVKAPYKDMIWERLDHGEKHKPYAEQLAGLAESMPDLFVQQQEPPAKPQFGAQTQGQMPTGDNGKSFMDTWGFVPKK